MILPLSWLSDFADVGKISAKQFCDRMTATGSKVEQFSDVAGKVENVVIGRILKIRQHPDAERLVVCRVDTGDGERQIVTAAKNVFEGAIVPVAKAPATLADGTVIKSGKLRGEVSDGMFCSYAELGLTKNDMPEAPDDGILILNEYGAEEKDVGSDVCGFLKMRDIAVEFEITPNRPDCLSVIGLAREAAASFDGECRIPEPKVREHGGDIADYLSVTVSSKKCARYSARVVRNVKIAPSPLWMRMRLRAAGVRPINNIVDITNYVMLEYGQPMHAFDYSCLDGGKIDVHTVEEGTEFITLDGETHKLKGGTLVIADGKKPVALAGVMGGLNSEIKDTTETVVFESACFDGASVRIAARNANERTESSSRFEKGLDAENTVPALRRACELVELLGAGETVKGEIDVYPEKKKVCTLPFEPDRYNRYLGINVPAKEQENILKKLHFGLKDGVITVPSYLDDVRCMNDVAEEIVRIHGYDAIESAPLVTAIAQSGLYPHQRMLESCHETLTACGLDEIYTFTFISAKWYEKCGIPEAERKSVEIMNPFGEDTKTMRVSPIPSMLETVARNCNYKAESLRLYEAAKVFIPRDGVVTNTHGLEGSLPDERTVFCIALYNAGDFYTLKGICEALCRTAGIVPEFRADSENPVYHPGRCADMFKDGVKLGTLGQLHPLNAKNYSFDKPVYIATVDFGLLYENRGPEKAYKPLPKYPAITRDFSFLCDKSTEIATIEACMKNAAGRLLESVALFDVYEGTGLPDGKKSVSFRVTLRASDRTLTDDEAIKSSDKIVSKVKAELGAELRA
ncbi:MAG: phenylalanine--tRNA ligase subunit beta [Clostridia bacterium]|nr:phenylalanine--tRNA ligase subunit beta [Clostridia bacterium]